MFHVGYLIRHRCALRSAPRRRARPLHVGHFPRFRTQKPSSRRAGLGRCDRASRFPTRLATDVDLPSHSGYLPCPDDRTGFELYIEPWSSASFEIGPEGIRAVADRDTMLTFRCSGRELDQEAATDAAATLAAMTDGVLYDSDSRHFIDAASALAWARGERYTPVATYRLRASRRRARLRCRRSCGC